MSSPILPPFTLQSATKKVKLAQALWNTTDHVKIAQAYTPDSSWRNRGEFAKGTKEIEGLLKRKWEKEQDYVLRKEVRSLPLSFSASGWPGAVVLELTSSSFHLAPLPPALRLQRQPHRRAVLV